MAEQDETTPPERIGSGVQLTVEECASQFESYAKGNPHPDRAHAYQHCADFLREFCVRVDSQAVRETQFQSPDENALHIAICQAVALLNRTINDEEQRQAHDILRNALDN